MRTPVGGDAESGRVRCCSIWVTPWAPGRQAGKFPWRHGNGIHFKVHRSVGTTRAQQGRCRHLFDRFASETDRSEALILGITLEVSVVSWWLRTNGGASGEIKLIKYQDFDIASGLVSEILVNSFFFEGLMVLKQFQEDCVVSLTPDS